MLILKKTDQKIVLNKIKCHFKWVKWLQKLTKKGKTFEKLKDS